MSDIVTIRAKGQLTLPLGVRNAAHIEEGDPLEVEVTPEGILLRPKKFIDADQAWFWTPGWQAGEREASADIAAGRTDRHDSSDAFLTSLAEE